MKKKTKKTIATTKRNTEQYRIINCSSQNKKGIRDMKLHKKYQKKQKKNCFDLGKIVIVRNEKQKEKTSIYLLAN